MTQAAVAERLRFFCRALAVAASLGAIAELWLVEHTEGWTQLLPFAMAACIVVSVGVVSFSPTPRVLSVHRALMALMLVGSAYGVYEHVAGNITFAREIRPSAAASEVWMAGLSGGNPAFAAGVLAVAGLLGLAGAYGMQAGDD
jgi:hypothetical protein